MVVRDGAYPRRGRDLEGGAIRPQGSAKEDDDGERKVAKGRIPTLARSSVRATWSRGNASRQSRRSVSAW